MVNCLRFNVGGFAGMAVGMGVAGLAIVYCAMSSKSVVTLASSAINCSSSSSSSSSSSWSSATSASSAAHASSSLPVARSVLGLTLSCFCLGLSSFAFRVCGEMCVRDSNGRGKSVS